MERRIINPWTWQDQFGFVQANEVSGPGRTLYCSGQTSVDAEGRPVHPGDMRAQITQVLDNLETVLEKAEFTLGNVVRINYYTPNMDLFLANWDVLGPRLAKAGCQPASVALQVSRLAFPDLLIEMEATAAA
jgi:enamine deaminase RidA (YjgF/YER057c/UK114 family)